MPESESTDIYYTLYVQWHLKALVAYYGVLSYVLYMYLISPAR